MVAALAVWTVGWAQGGQSLRRDLTDDALQIVHAGELDDELATSPPHLDIHAGLEQVGQLLGHRGQLRCLRRARPGGARGTLGRAQRHDLFDGAHRQPFGDDAGRQPVLRVRVVEGKQRPRMTCGQHAGCHPPLHCWCQVHQPQRVADMRAGTADPVCQLLVCGAELLQQLLVGRCLFQWVELLAVQVLQQGVAQQRVVGGFAHNSRYDRKVRLSARSPASLPHDELVAAWLGLAHHDGLQHADSADARDELGQGLLVEHLPRLARVRLDAVEWKLLQPSTGEFLFGRPGRDQRAKASTETTTADVHGVPSPLALPFAALTANS